MVTIRDVASRAGVSIATVSRVLNRTGNYTAETEKRVRGAVEELGYTTNLTARSLKTGRTGTIAILMMEYVLLETPEIIGSVCRVVQEQGFTLEMIIDGDLEHAVTLMGEGKHDGLLLIDPLRDEAALSKLVKTNQSFVLLGGETDREDVNLVEIDHFGAGYTVTSELIAQGHRDILFIEDNGDLLYTKEIKRGYLFALDENGIPYKEELLVRTSGWTGGKESIGYDALQATTGTAGYTAVLTTNDRIAFGVLSAARMIDLSVPLQLSVIGYGDLPQSDHAIPPLSTVTVPYRQLGELGAEILVNNISRRDRIVKRVKLQTQMVHRNSLSKIPSQ